MSEEYEYDYYSSYDYDPWDTLASSPPSEDINIHDIETELHPETTSPPVEVDNNDDRVAFSLSINQSRLFIQDHLGISHHALRANHVPGLVILRLEDFALIRDTTQRHRQIPHLLYLANPSDNDELHPELNYIAQFLAHPH